MKYYYPHGNKKKNTEKKIHIYLEVRRIYIWADYQTTVC